MELNILLEIIKAVIGTILVILGISDILAFTNYKNTQAADRTEVLIALFLVASGIFLISL